MSDYISKQDVIKEICKQACASSKSCGVNCLDNCLEVDIIEHMPPAPVKEVVTCGECKHSEHWYGDKSRCFLWHETGIDVFEDGFCNYGERKEQT